MFVYDVDKCIGCKACQVACKDKNNLEPGTFFRRVDTFEHEGNFIHFSIGCNHCENAICVKECPTGAMYKKKDGTIAHDPGKCIGCGSCVWTCPYGAPKLSKEKGIAQKCDSCSDLREKGEKPACVQACITYCLDFKEVHMTEECNYPSFLPPGELTKPSLLIRKKGDVV